MCRHKARRRQGLADEVSPYIPVVVGLLLHLPHPAHLDKSTFHGLIAMGADPFPCASTDLLWQSRDGSLSISLSLWLLGSQLVQ